MIIKLNRKGMKQKLEFQVNNQYDMDNMLDILECYWSYGEGLYDETTHELMYNIENDNLEEIVDYLKADKHIC